ncbi:MAG: bifunctional YncE family protein/alkaline phosphatase family protein, partial [Bryobacteraceae bacterium]
AVVPLIYNNELAVVDLETRTIRGKVKTEIAPFGAVINKEGKTAYVTNWGGRIPSPDDLTAPTGLSEDADRVVVDERGIASTGTVTRIDLSAMQSTHTIPVELHPTAIVWDEPRHRVYVANGNKDSVSVIDSRQNKVVQTISIQPFPRQVNGIAPAALAVSPDGGTLYVACGGINAVVVVKTETGKIDGMIPTAWYPSGLAVSEDGSRLAITALLGVGSGWRDEPSKRFVHAYRGSVAVIDIPDRNQLASYTTAVAENNRMSLTAEKQTPSETPVAIPARSGDPSLIEHVVYIIKENRTYDQLFGDLQKGNGEPSFVMFGEDVTPNHRKLADQFVLLDNFFATGGNSGDGHQWVTQANETAYALWPGYLGRSYPFDGTDPIAYSSGGFIWDLALRQKKTVRVYGEYVGRMPEPSKVRRGLLERWKNGEDFSSTWNVTAAIDPLNDILARNYPSYTNSIPDVIRAQIFLKDLKKWEEEGEMPNFTIVQLPCDHTFGTAPEVSTPKAMVADNDLALGQIVEALSKSRFWKKMAIFVVEDDAQNGVDHVDGHRTVALAISPYTKRGHVDSTFYSHQSILKTIELILGLPTLSLFDLIANDMRASFQDTPDLTAYESVTPKQSLEELNPPLKALKGQEREDALASQNMRWDVPDAAPTEKLNRIVWRQVMGWDKPYPQPRNAVFAPLSIDVEDEDREEGPNIR